MDKIQFKDTSAEIKCLYYTGTYDNFIEGSRETASRAIIKHECEMLEKHPDGYIVVDENGIVNIRELCNDKSSHIVLPEKRYVIEVRTDWEHRLNIIWYAPSIDFSRPLCEFIEPYTRNIEFFKHCQFFDLDNF